MFNLFASLFAGIAGGWLHHALYVRPAQLKGAPAPVAAAVEGLDQVAIGAADAEVAQAAGGPKAPAASTYVPAVEQAVETGLLGAADGSQQSGAPSDAPSNPLIGQ